MVCRSDIERWWARKLADLGTWWCQLIDEARQWAIRSAKLRLPHKVRPITASKKPHRARPRRPFGAGMLPAVAMPARRAIGAFVALVAAGVTGFGTSAMAVVRTLGDVVRQAIAESRPLKELDLCDYHDFIKELNAKRLNIGLAPVAESGSDEKTFRAPKPRGRTDEPQPQSDYGERIHDLRPDDEIKGLRL